MIDKEIENLLGKYLEGKLSREEKARVERWLESELQQERITNDEWGSSKKVELLNRIHDKIHQRKETQVVPLRRWIQVAAAILIIVTAFFYTWQYTQTDRELYSQAGGTIEKVMLSDGTIVWLKANSKLSYPESFASHTRNVRLEGEALFEVFKDAQHPFVIQCGRLTATVLGTSFNIREGKDTIEVAVLTGKVGLTSPDDQKGIIVLPHEKAIFTERQIARVETTQREIASITATTEYNMDFKETRIREILRRIEGKFGVIVQLRESNIMNCPLTADFTDQSLEVTLRNISNVLDFEYTIDKKVVTIIGGTCQ